MRYLGLDVGTRRTGAAIADDKDDILFSIATIEHTDFETLTSAVLTIVREKKIDLVVLGLPLLLSGEEGAQVQIVRSFGHELAKKGVSCRFVDERFSTPSAPGLDKDSSAACSILSSILRV